MPDFGFIFLEGVVVYGFCNKEKHRLRDELHAGSGSQRVAYAHCSGNEGRNQLQTTKITRDDVNASFQHSEVAPEGIVSGLKQGVQPA